MKRFKRWKIQQRLMRSVTLISFIIFNKSYVMWTKRVRELFSFSFYILFEKIRWNVKKAFLNRYTISYKFAFLLEFTHISWKINACTRTHTFIRTCTNTHAMHIRTSTHAYEISTMSNVDMCWEIHHPVRCLIIANKK